MDMTVKLPDLQSLQLNPLEELLSRRRSVREYTTSPVTVAKLSRLLWAAQGITDEQGLRTAPSAGALYPLELYCAAGNVEGLNPGIYRYRLHGHKLEKFTEGDWRNRLAAVALNQECIAEGTMVLVFAAVYARTMRKYGERGIQYVHIEIGHAAQNVCLQATALGLATATIGAFDDENVKRVMHMRDEEAPLYIMPVGNR